MKLTTKIGVIEGTPSEIRSLLDELETKTKVIVQPIETPRKVIRRAKNLTNEQTTKIRWMRKQGRTIVDIRKELGISYHKVYGYLKRQGESTRRKRYLDHNNEALTKLVRMRNQGKTIEEISKAIKYSGGSISRTCRNLGLQKTPKKMSDKSGYRKFLSTRVKWLMHNYNYDYQKAVEYARTEWMKNKKSAELEQPSFPTLKTIDERRTGKLKYLLETCIKNGREIHYSIHNEVLGLRKLEEWQTFLAEFQLHSKEISDYYGIENKFNVIANMIISYGR